MTTLAGAVTDAKTFVAITLRLARATGRPDRALHYAVSYFRDPLAPIGLTWRGLEFAARGVDWAAIHEVLIDGEYEPLRPALAGIPTPIVLDIGANIGTFSLFALAIAPSAIVHALEPSSASHRLLAANARANPNRAWHTHHGAAWSQDGTIAFSNAALSTASRVTTETGDERVPAWTLARLLAQAGGWADLVKVDIEGAEEAVLGGGQGELAQIGTLVVEIHPDRCRELAIMGVLRDAFPRLYAIPGRKSSKPLILATRHDAPWRLPTVSSV